MEQKRQFNHIEVRFIRDFICLLSFVLNPKFRKSPNDIGKFETTRVTGNVIDRDYRYYIKVEWGEFFKKYE